mmetsp:Transcript_59999/g.69482  ORF Transcript_59999/g.69482 Transcript_59999/m.69482 type:complete len:215 (+) Transcript_59999:359-1003(+)
MELLLRVRKSIRISRTSLTRIEMRVDTTPIRVAMLKGSMPVNRVSTSIRESMKRMTMNKKATEKKINTTRNHTEMRTLIHRKKTEATKRKNTSRESETTMLIKIKTLIREKSKMSCIMLRKRILTPNLLSQRLPRLLLLPRKKRMLSQSTRKLNSQSTPRKPRKRLHKAKSQKLRVRSKELNKEERRRVTNQKYQLNDTERKQKEARMKNMSTL